MTLTTFAPITETEREAAQQLPQSTIPPAQISVVSPIPSGVPPMAATVASWISPETGAPRGRPNAQWGYTNESGQHLFFVARWDMPDGSKDIRSVAWCRNSATGEESWSFKHHGEPRPLYNLFNLARKPEAPVIIVEGEAKADIAASIFPQSIGTTSAGGANAAHKSDWSPLKGRKRVLIWPDANDAQKKNADGTLGPRPGDMYASKVAELIAAQGVEQILIVDAMRLAKMIPNGDGEREPPQGWDIKDAIAEGWDAAKLREAAVACAVEYRKQEIAPAKSYLSFAQFKMSEVGLFFEESKTKKNASGETESATESVFVCDAFEILGRARDPNGCDWAQYIRWQDADGREHLASVKEGELHGDGVAVASMLQSQGLQISRNHRGLFLDYLSRARTDKRLTLVQRSGWHQIDGKQSFVLSTLNSQGVVLDSAAPSPFEISGTLADWRNGVGALVSGHSRAVLAVSITFSGPLLRLCNAEGGGFNLFGKSSLGKSTLASAAASVWGKGASGGFLYSWRTTANASEAAAAICSDTLLVLDELGTVDAKEAFNSIYSLANGQGKARANRSGDLRQPKNWRVPIMSTGEMPMEAKLAEDRQRGAKAGQQVRLLDIPADAGKGFGVFDHAGPDNDPAKLSQEIKREAETNFGTAGPAFVSKILREGADKVSDAVRAAIAQFVFDCLPNGADGQVQRVAQRLAVIAAAGELATRWGVTPWAEGEAKQACRDALNDWIAVRGGTEAAEVREAIARVRSVIEAHGASRFEDLAS